MGGENVSSVKSISGGKIFSFFFSEVNTRLLRAQVQLFSTPFWIIIVLESFTVSFFYADLNLISLVF